MACRMRGSHALRWGRAGPGRCARQGCLWAHSRKVQPNAVKVPSDPWGKSWFAELRRPATKQDVTQGKAVFTLEGLGQSRVWKLPECPMFCAWPELKDYPWPREPGENIHYQDCGYVCQAEELLVGGKWKRYFGFVCEHGAAVVPAGRIELSFDAPKTVSYERLNGGIDWGTTDPGRTAQEGKKETHPRPADPLPVDIYIRNRRGDEQEVSTVFYRSAKEGGPAFLQGIGVSLKWMPFDPRSPNEDYCINDKSYRPVPSIRDAHFAPGGPKRPLKSGESFKAFTFDLHDWFKIDQTGYYRMEFEFDEPKMGLSNRRDRSGRCLYIFAVGDPPRQRSLAELNREIEPFGSKENERRLVKLIKETVAVKTPELNISGAQPDALLPWSKPAGGLAARIEFVARGGVTGLVVLVRLKNVSGGAITVPTGNPSDSHAARLFELYTQRQGDAWRRTAWFPGEHVAGPGPKADRHGTIYSADDLKPGESCLAYLCGREDTESGRRRDPVCRKHQSRLAPGGPAGERRPARRAGDGAALGRACLGSGSPGLGPGFPFRSIFRR